MVWYIWLIIAGLFLVIEMITVGFLVFWLAIAALLTMLVSFITDNIIIQTTVFVISSGILLFFTKPFVSKYVTNNTTVTNAFNIIGKRATVTQDIIPSKSTGQIKVESEVWSAKSENDLEISKGTEVEILDIDGVKAIVRIY